MKNKKKHVTKEERFCIEKMLRQGETYRKIATTLQRGVSTICEEVSKNNGREHYNAEKAHHRAYVKQKYKKRNHLKVATDPFLSNYVEKELRRYISPERISGRLKKEYGMIVSAKAIRKFTYSRGLESFLYRKGKRKNDGYVKPVAWEETRVFVDDPRCVRVGYGHWEIDFIVSSHNTEVLLVMVERLTKRSVLRTIPTRNNDLVREVIVTSLSSFTVNSVTVDNDIAFIKHSLLSDELGAPVYFARPYTSTDKALVENTNRWIRWFIPKKTDLQKVSASHIKWIQEWLNTAPKQCLGFATATEMLLLEELKVRCSY